MSVHIDAEVSFDDFTVTAAFQAGAGLTALYGPSGAGKTTILNMIAGTLKPSRGSIVADGQVLFDSNANVNLKPNRRRVGYIFQDARLFPHLSVRNNLLYGYRLSEQATRYAELDHIVELLGITHLMARRPETLSGGEQQRVAIGRAILSSPRMLLMDEPLSSLDDARKQEILPYIQRLKGELRIPILYVTHTLPEVRHFADAVLAVENGKVAIHQS